VIDVTARARMWPLNAGNAHVLAFVVVSATFVADVCVVPCTT